MKKSTPFILFFLLLPLSSLFAWELNATFYSTKDGLGNNFVRHIYQDSKGFLWLSTINGLSRYDGHSFINFQPDSKEKISLPDHHIREVVEDKNHFLWIQISPEYFSCYDLRKEQFVDFTGNLDYNDRFSHRFEASNGDIWMWESNGGCRRVWYQNNKFHSILFNLANKKLPSNNVRQIKQDDKNNIWVCTDKGVAKIKDDRSQIYKNNIYIGDIEFYKNKVFVLTKENIIYKLDDKKGILQKIEQLDDNNAYTANIRNNNKWIIITHSKGHIFDLASEKVSHNSFFDLPNGQISRDNRGNFCFYNDKGVVRYLNISTGRVKELFFPIRDAVVNNWCRVLVDKRGWIWFATFGNGLYIYNPKNEEITHIENKLNAENLISSNSLSNILEDRSGGIWLSSETAGLTHLTVINDNITYIYPENQQLMDNSNSVRLVNTMSNGEIWIGNRDKTLFRYNAQMTNQLGKTQFASSIYSILEEGNGRVWYGSRGNGLYIDNKYILKGSDSTSLPSEKISTIFRDYKNRKWIGVFTSGLSLATEKQNKLVFHNFFQQQESQGFRSIISDKNNWMWAGTDNGLIIFHPDSLLTNPKNYYVYSYDNNKLLAKRVKYVFMDSKKRVWLGTLGGGVSMCEQSNDYKHLKFKHFTTTQGLCNNVVQSIIEDKEGKIWIATEYGLSRYTPEKGTFENFYFSKLLIGNVYNENSVLQLADKRLIFGTYHGLLILDPSKIKSTPLTSQIIFTDLKANGISMQPSDNDSPITSSIAYTNEVDLKYNQNSISIEFSTFDFSNNTNSKYSYKLEPFDTEWSTPSTLNSAVYKKLPPGTYSLKVKACGPTGIWSEKIATLKIKVHPPFWSTPIAYFLYIVLLTLIAYTAFRILRNFYSLRNKLLFEEELTNYKLMFFTNISHEFRTPLTLIRGALEKVEEVSTQSKELKYPVQIMLKSTDRMLRLVNQILEFRKMQNNKLSLSLELANIIPFLLNIHQSFEELAADKSINFRFEPTITHFEMYVDKDKIDKIVYNLLSNAFKYTPSGGTIIFAIDIDAVNSQLILSVTDNGVGIPIEKQGDLFSRFMQSSFSKDSIGIGLHLTHELVNVHKGNISYAERQGGGSIFTVKLSTDKSIYNEVDFLQVQYLDNFVSGDDNITNSETDIELNENYSKPESPKKLLLIEDDIDVCKYLSNELSAYFDVTTANDGITGLEKAQSFDGDLIICDVLMPGMNGFEVTRRLKSNFDTSHIPIILLTAMSSVEHQLEGIQAGADSYITKPFSPKYLITRIFKLIEQREILQQKFARVIGVNDYQINFTDKDKEFIEKIQKWILENLTNENFSVDMLADMAGTKRTNFFKKMKSITGHSPNEYINVIRMKKAAELLTTSELNISEISYEIGIDDPSYFIRYFKSQFGKTPLQFRKDKG